MPFVLSVALQQYTREGNMMIYSYAMVFTMIRVTAVRMYRTVHAILTVTKRHVPTWMGFVITAALLIPGPVDELAVLIVIGVMVAFKPLMRADLASSIVAAWNC